MIDASRIMIAAPKSGSGKTLITCALIRALTNKGLSVKSVKCGPDYIDPMFHQSVLDIPSSNLDTFFTDCETTRSLFYDAAAGCDICVMEGVMGLFDGAAGYESAGSSYDLARVCRCPVILVVDTKGSARSVIPLIQGFLAYDREDLIRGVILNNMSKHLYESLMPLFKEELSVPVLGYFPNDKTLGLKSRHLGLVTPNEQQEVLKELDRAAHILGEGVDINGIIDISGSAEKIPGDSFILSISPEKKPDSRDIVIAVARDDAFCFYYDINLRILEALGARIEYFSPLYDSALPKGTKGIILGGGYPELYAKKLSENTRMLLTLKEAIDSDMPSLAECGGFMYLHKSLTDEKGDKYSLLGVIDADVSYRGRPIRFGYATFSENSSHFLPPGCSIRGHEFHYFDSEKNGRDCTAKKPYSKKSWECNMVESHHWWGFGHLYYPSAPDFAKSFVAKCKDTPPL